MEKRLAPIEILGNLAMFIGTEHFYRVPIGNFVYTDGIKYMAEQCGAYWLITDTGIRSKMLMARSPFVKIVANCTMGNVSVEYTDGNGEILFENRYTGTDFPLDILTMYFTGNTLLLPGEY